MGSRNELLEVAIEECRKLGLPYRYEELKRSRHIKFFVANSPRIVIIAGSHATRDMRVVMNVRRDIVKSAAMINGVK